MAIVYYDGTFQWSSRELERRVLDFEHLIQVNDPDEPGLEPVERNALWQALVYRARYPDHFNPTLDCRLEADGELGFVRWITAGGIELRDEVTLVPDKEIHTLIDGRDQPMHAESVTRIEEPEPGYLFVRFIYRRDSISAGQGVDADEFMKSAYLQNDRDAIKMIRQMIADGWSDAHM